ncbi:MAG: hypothetical protein IH948_05410 [Bacteroidetes bacterium]|nr:hypothetical protein [Bacteroidota bacterium]
MTHESYRSSFDDFLGGFPELKYGIYAGVALAILMASRHFLRAITYIIIECKKMRDASYM